MNFRNAIKAIFGRLPERTTSAWKEIGGFRAYFSPTSGVLYANEIARACIHTLAEHTSKANMQVQGGDKQLENLIDRPNLYMNTKDFLYKVRTKLETNNTVFVYINRDDKGKVTSLYPMPACKSEAVEYMGALYILFSLPTGVKLTASWEDLLVLRKHYNDSDIYGATNAAIQTSLELLNTVNQGMSNAIQSTANLRGILKSTKAMLTDDDIKKQKDRFVADYLSLENSSGIAMLDSTVDFKPITMQPVIANYKHVEELRKNIYSYFGVNEKALTSELVGDEWNAFYEAQIQPFLIALGLEMSNKILTERQRKFGQKIIFESNRMQYMSTKDKLDLVQLVDRGILTPNEMRVAMNLKPLKGGDIPVRRLDTVPVTDLPASKDKKEGKENDNERQDVQEL